MEFHVAQWTWQNAATSPPAGFMRCDTGIPATATALILNRLPLAQPTGITVDELMAYIAVADTVRVDPTGGSTTVLDYEVTAPPTALGDTWTIPVALRAGTGAVPEVTVEVGFLIAATAPVDPTPATGWPTVADCQDRLGVDPADASAARALTASLDGVTAMVLRERLDLLDPATGQPATTLDADTWLGIVILACLDYRAANTPAGFAGYDGGYSGTADERFRGYQLCRISRYAPPRAR